MTFVIYFACYLALLVIANVLFLLVAYRRYTLRLHREISEKRGGR